MELLRKKTAVVKRNTAAVEENAFSMVEGRGERRIQMVEWNGIYNMIGVTIYQLVWNFNIPLFRSEGKIYGRQKYIESIKP